MNFRRFDHNGVLRVASLTPFTVSSSTLKPRERHMIIDTQKIRENIIQKAKELNDYADHKITQAKPEVASFLRKVADHINPQPK